MKVYKKCYHKVESFAAILLRTVNIYDCDVMKAWHRISQIVKRIFHEILLKIVSLTITTREYRVSI